jgi:hypothetical protein
MTGGTEADDVAIKEPGRIRKWLRRSSVRSLKRDYLDYTSEILDSRRDRDNEETRLPDSEEVNFGGLVLTEAFTPSTVSRLFDVIERWPTTRRRQRDEWLEDLAASRAGERGGWQTLGVVRPIGESAFGDGINDAALPAGVDAVWLHMSFLTPTLAMVVATFTFDQDTGDLSTVLRQDYEWRRFDPELQINGRLAGLRARIPWSRPESYRLSSNQNRAIDEKREACDAAMNALEGACSDWFFAKFRGRFGAVLAEERPTIRMLFTTDQVPYQERHPWFGPVGLDFAYPLWRSSERDGWWLSEDRWPYRGRSNVMTLAGRRMDAAEKPGSGPEPGESNWYLTQSFGSDQAPLAGRHALVALLATYSNRLAALRDKAAIRPLFRRPVREGHALDEYLVSEGLDAATLTLDLASFTEDLTAFRFDVPEFIESREHLEGPAGAREPMEYVPSLCTAIHAQAARLRIDSTATIEGIKASAELRQAIAATRLQRFTLLLSIAAAIIAGIGILVASHWHL